MFSALIFTCFLLFQAPHNSLVYSIEESSQYGDRFELEPTTGELYLRRSLVGETPNQYTVSETVK
jgi:hypothetical protein